MILPIYLSPAPLVLLCPLFPVGNGAFIFCPIGGNYYYSILLFSDGMPLYEPIIGLLVFLFI